MLIFEQDKFITQNRLRTKAVRSGPHLSAILTTSQWLHTVKHPVDFTVKDLAADCQTLYVKSTGQYRDLFNMENLALTHFNIRIKHAFPCINVCQVPREMLKTEAVGRGFQHLPRDLANVNVLENNV